MASSDPKRLDQVYHHLQLIKAGEYAVIQGNSAGPDGGYRIVEKPWQALPEPIKLEILQHAVDWSGISSQDMACILLSEIDLNKIPDAARNRLNSMVLAHRNYGELLQEAAARGGGQTGKEQGLER